MDLLLYSAVELAAAIKEGKATAVQAMEAVLARIGETEGTINAYVTIDKEAALAAAQRTQEKIASGAFAGPLAGVPVAVKDNLCTKGILTTCASRMLGNFVPTFSAEAVTKLEHAGAVVIGKTNMDEFAMGSTTETSAYGETKNPWNLAHVPGGSSGGSAAAVASNECFFALGSDTGGSIRQPASFCGVVGLKPTYGTVSRYGLVAYGSSLDQIGPLTKNVSDCAAVLEVIAAQDEKDSTSIKREDTDFAAALLEDAVGLRIGIPRDYFGEGLDAEVRKAVLAAADALSGKGAVVEEFDLGLVEYAIPTYYTIAAAEASSNLERFDGVKYGYRAQEFDGLHEMYKKTRSEGFGAEVKRRIMLGSFVLSSGYYDAYYLKALKVKAMIKKAFDDAFANFDLILGPVAPTTAPRLGESLSDPLKMYLGDIYTISVNLAGLPAISVPCGKDTKGLPIGLQLIADSFQEKKLLRAAYTYEQLRGAFDLCTDPCRGNMPLRRRTGRAASREDASSLLDWDIRKGRGMENVSEKCIADCNTI
jgi:aspartyl-tRNA(Asn)/glutamyl-tRNA(Gln) amidotransferase subunit A